MKRKRRNSTPTPPPADTLGCLQHLLQTVGPKGETTLPTPEPPEHLDATAKDEWRRIIPELARFGLIVTLDRAVLANYCSAWSRLIEAERQLPATGGLVVKSPSGFPIQNPYLSIVNAAAAQVNRLLAELGLSPSAREKLLKQLRSNQ